MATNRSSRQAAFRPTRRAVSKSGTWQEMSTGSPTSPASRVAVDRPVSRVSQVARAPIPAGLMTPSPVTATSRH